MSNLGKVLVLLATYNGEKFVEEQIETILNQEDVDVEIDISDDSSRDLTLDKVDKYVNNDGVTLKVNKPGTGSAANNFMSLVEAVDINRDFEYVSFSDQDDLWLKNKLYSAVKKLQESQSVLYASNLTKWDIGNNSYSELKKDHKQKRFDYLFEGGSAGCTYVMTKAFFIEVQNKVKNLDYKKWDGFSHDWFVYFIARLNNGKVYIDGNSYIEYRIHGENVHGHLNKFSIQMIKEKSRLFFNGYYFERTKKFMELLEKGSEEYKIYKRFNGGYFERMGVIVEYNFQLMRDRKKFFIFFIYNLINVTSRGNV